MIQSPTVTSTDRFGFTLFMAVVIHAVVMLGISFSIRDKPAAPPTLEVTLAKYESAGRPKDADYLAQINQQGSGTLEQKALPSSDQLAQFQANEIKEVQPQSQTEVRPEQIKRRDSQVVTQARSTHTAANTNEERKPVPETEVQEQPRKRIDLRSEIESLEAHFNNQRQEYAKRPRIKRLTAASTMQEPGAYYKEAWRRKVERIGNLNYPEQARQNSLYGELRLMVAINHDGTLSDVEVLQSSGQKVLDDAAMRIVKLASPFAPFGDDLRSYDMVEIIRTWRFEPGHGLFSQ